MREAVVIGCLRQNGYPRAVAERRAALLGTTAYPCHQCRLWHVAPRE